ncbi:hypothetical protein CSUI_004688 [Cystoisospora suis]|uniref:Secreted protein n=1 Tax=Cystoisospora suis TaxID=483139 RepID=A0A2C6KLW8_9APIC|nr:hypothetical protein CSUI_004688 [Cystoisospora suis]
MSAVWMLRLSSLSALTVRSTLTSGASNRTSSVSEKRLFFSRRWGQVVLPAYCKVQPSERATRTVGRFFFCATSEVHLL